MSMPTRSALTPNCSLSRVWSAISAACSSALVGMQPRCRQVPYDTLDRRTLAAIEREERRVAWFRRRRGPVRPTGRAVDRADLEYLADFVHTRSGVEAFIEPRTTVTETTVLLVAHDGEWT